MTSKERSIVIVGVGAIILVAFVAVLSIFSFFGPDRGVTSEVAQKFESHLQQIESLNATRVMQGYTANASTTWKGGAGGYAGTYSPSRNISVLYLTFLSRFSSLTIANTSDSITLVGNRASLNGSFSIAGFIPPVNSGCPRGGNFTGKVDVAVTFVRDSGGWLITREIWNFIYPFSSGICH